MLVQLAFELVDLPEEQAILQVQLVYLVLLVLQLPFQLLDSCKLLLLFALIIHASELLSEIFVFDAQYVEVT